MKQPVCPECGSKNVRLVHYLSLLESLAQWVGVHCWRCRECDARFRFRSWDKTSWLYARCPKCFRTDLTTWSEKYYRPGWWDRMLLRFGARRMRCEPCRCNFVTYRIRKEIYRKRHWKVSDGDGSATPEQESVTK